MAKKSEALEKIQELQKLVAGETTSDRIGVLVKELEPLLEGNEAILRMLGTFLGNIGYASTEESGISLKWIEELIKDRERQIAALQVFWSFSTRKE